MGKLLSGNKTYALAIAVIIGGILKRFDLVDAATINMAITVLMGGGLMALRAGVKKSGPTKE